ncbi:MAG: hypothetical protein ABI986_08405, partial [Chloroflexota bacterium]
YSYTLNNPLRYTDPTGHKVACGITGEDACEHDDPPPGGGNGGGGGVTCGQQGVYSPSCPGWHNYTTTNLVCPAYLHCTLEQMQDYLSRFAYPGQDPSNPVDIIGYFNVTDPWYGELPKSIGPILTVVSPDGLTVTNTTLPGHILYDGKIVRHAFQGPNGEWYVGTHGYGNNKSAVFDAQRPDLPPLKVDLALANIWGGKAIFNKVDALMLNYIVENHP